MRFRNAPNTTLLKPEHSNTWFDYVLTVTCQKKPVQCAVQHCKNTAEVGGHVFREGDTPIPSNYYLLPICKACNNPENTSFFEVKPNAKAIRENQGRLGGIEAAIQIRQNTDYQKFIKYYMSKRVQ